MKRYFLILMSLLAVAALNAAVNTQLRYFTSDFSNPTADNPLCGWTCYGSGKTAAETDLGVTGASLRDYFPEGSAPYVLLTFKGLPTIPWSNSSFTENVSADEWLISPGIDLSDAPENVMLDFDVLSFGSTNECKFEVYVSSTGNKPEDFTEKAVYTGRQKGSTREIVSSTIHRVLKGVGGKTVWLAFVNKSTNAQLTGFSNISIAEYDIDVTNKAPTFTTTAGSYNVDVEVSVMTPVSCRGFVARLEYADGSSQEYTTDKQLNTRYSTYSFSFPDPIVVAWGDTKDYTITITPNYEGATPTKLKSTLVCREGYPGVCVMEEGTGTWCGYCVRGIAAMNYYKKTLGDRFIGIAVHDEDPMEVYDYLTPWSNQSGLKSFPSSWVNRQFAADPAMACDIVMEYASRNVGQRITIESMEFDTESSRAKVSYSAEYCYDIASADVAVVAVVTEDDCSNSGAGWSQNNYYSGSTKENWLSEKMPEAMWDYMEPFVNAGERIPSTDIPFDHVARGVFHNYYGDEAILPCEWKDGQAQNFTLSFEFPTPETAGETAVVDWKNTAVAILLVDRISGRILNADLIEAKDYKVDGAGVEKTALSCFNAQASSDGIAVSGCAGATVDVYRIDGTKLYSDVMDSDRNIIKIHADGLVIVRMSNGTDTFVRKIIL